MKRVIKWFAILLFSLLFLTVSTVGALLFSPWGVTGVLWGVQKVLPNFHVAKNQGKLLDGLYLEGIDIQIAGIDVKAKELFVDLSAACLLRSKKICVETFTANDVRVVVSEMQSEGRNSTPAKEINAPLPIQIANFALTDVYIDALGYQFSSGSLKTGVEWVGDTIKLKPTQWQKIAITSVDNATKKENKAKPTAKDPIARDIVLPQVTLPLKLIVEDVKITEVKLNDELILATLALKAKAQGNQVGIDSLYLDVPQGILTASANANLTGNYPLDLDAKVSIKQQPLQKHDLTLKARGDLNKLIFDANLAGKLKAVLTGNINLLDADLPFDVLLSSKHLQWPIDKGEYQLNNTRIKGKGSLKAYQATVATLVKSKAIPNTRLNTTVKGNLQSISLSQLKVNTLDGVIFGQAKASWGKQVAWQSALAFEDIQPGTFWQEAEGSISGNFEQQGTFNSKNGWSVDVSKLDIKGIIRKQAFALNGELSAAGNPQKGDIHLDTKGLALRHGKNTVQLKGTIDEKIALDLDVNIPSLASSIPKMKGYIKGKIDLSGSLKKPQAGINLTVNALSYGKQVVGVREARIRGSFATSPTLGGGLVASVKGIKAKGVDYTSLDLSFSGDEKKHNLSLVLKGEPVSKQLNIIGSLNDQLWKGTITKSNIDTILGKWSLNRSTPASFNLKNSSLTLGSLCWQQKKSRICIDDTQTQKTDGQTRLAIKNYNLSALNKLLPESTNLKGSLDGKADISWQANALPKVDLQFSLAKGRIVQKVAEDQQRLRLNWDEVNLTSLIQNNKINSKLTLDLAEDGSLVLDMLVDKLNSKKPKVHSYFSVNKVNLAAIAPTLEKDAKLGGVLDGSFSVMGDLMEPKANGRLAISSLSLQKSISPVTISDGSIVMRLNGQTANLTGKVYTPDGVLNVKGDADWHKINNWFASLNVNSKKLTLAIPPMVNMQIVPNLTMKASAKSVEVTGKVAIPWGRIEVQELPPSAIKVSGDMVILDEQLKPVANQKNTALPINADLRIELGDDVRLDAFGLRTQVVGNLSVESMQKGVNVFGEITLNDGLYRSFGQDLKIKSGKVRFNGPADQPYLQIVAIRNPEAIEDDVEAGIRVLGTPDAPNIEIYSVPVMAQANALSYLTRGRNLDSDTGGDAITSMLIGLGLSQSGVLVGKIGEAFGVQDLSVDTAGQGNNEQVVVSGYILPGLQVKYGVGIFTSIPEFTLRYNLLRNLYLEAVSGADTAVDLLYQFSIN